MSEQIAQEPTMEEILASIRRIISEDETPGGEAQEAAPTAFDAPAEPQGLGEGDDADDEDVLELNQPYDEPEPQHAGFDDIEAFARPESEAPPSFQAPPVGEGLVDEPIARSVASAFASISMNMALPREGRTLEDLVKELMYPILREWLNQNLPTIVEAQVRAEVDRLSRLRAAL